MMNWRHQVKIRHLLTDQEDATSVRMSMKEITDVLDKSPCFAGFSTKKFRAIPDGDDVITPLDYGNRLLDRMYDFADEHRIWLE